MAKNKKNKEEITEENEIDDNLDKNTTKKKKKGGCLTKLIILSVFISLLVAILGFNLGNIRDKYLRGTLEKIPIVKNLLPPIEETNIMEEETLNEEETVNSLISEIENLNNEIKRLKEFENAQAKFKKEKEEFDRLIALNDTKAYSEFYEKISPENAEKLYKEAIVKESLNKEFKDYIKTFENMKKDAASKILEELIITDMDLVISILSNLPSDNRAEILSVMDPKNAASVTKLLSPQK